MSALELAKHEAVNSGECEIKYDEQLRMAVDFQDLAFDFMVSIQTTPEFQEALNHDSWEEYDLNKYMMDTLTHGTNGHLEDVSADVSIDLHPPNPCPVND